MASAAIAQLVERRHGKAKVTSSNLVGGSIQSFHPLFLTTVGKEVFCFYGAIDSF